jgi:uroporphyrinogen decarboxylase
MDSRTRVLNILARKPVDRIPMHDAFWEDTLAQWRTQGLGEADPCDRFDMDFDAMYLDLSARQEQKVLEEDGRLVTIQDRAGYVVRKFISKSRSLEFLDHCTKEKDDWPRWKDRLVLDPDGGGEARLDRASYFMHLAPYPTWDEAKAIYDEIRTRGRFLLFHAYGPWEATWRHRGIDRLLLDIALDPDWVREMAQAHMDLLIEVLQHAIGLGMKPDGLFLADDFGCTRGLLFSPQMWRDAYKPMYVQLANFLHDSGISFWLHSCGDVRELIPEFIDVGLDVLQALQVSAGMDVRELIPQYGRDLAFFGNISASGMSGPAEDVEREIREKFALAREQGAYIYHSDHSIPPEVSFDRYRQVMDWVRRYGAFAENNRD